VQNTIHHLFKPFFILSARCGLQGLALIAFSLFSAIATAQNSSDQPHVKVSLHAEQTAIVAGESFNVALRLQPDEGWHTYWRNPGDTGLPTRIEWQLPAGFVAGEIEWPVPERIDYEGLVNIGYHGDTWLIVPISTPPNLEAGEQTLIATARWLVCEKVCIPGSADLSITLPVVTTNVTQPVATQWANYFSKARSKLPVLLSDIDARYAVDEEIIIRISAADLPVFSQPPEVFLTTAGIVANDVAARMSVSEHSLDIHFKKDAYFSEPPPFVGVVLANAEQAYEFIAHLDAALHATPNEAPITIVETNAGLLSTLPTALLFALLGGLILNAMPCVFPVLSLKVISLVESGSHSNTERQLHGLTYTAGVVLSFLLVAVLLIALRGVGEQIGWGFQLQSPLFVGLLVYVLFVLGLSMSGVIEIGTGLQNVGAGIADGDANSWKKSFFTGVLATVVATPCTAPFMGTAMGFALSQPLLVALVVFAAMGLGLALPFLLIAFIPALANALPQPGAWMVRLKEFLAFPIYLTVVWLVWVFARQTGTDPAALLLIGLVSLAFSAWYWRSTLYIDRTVFTKGILLISAVIAVVALLSAAKFTDSGFAINKEESGDAIERVYSPDALASAIASGETVFVNMTADWCITCKVNERVALKSAAVQQALVDNNVTYLKGDWTNSDPKITQYLGQFNRNGVPLYVVYKNGQPPVVLPQLLTTGRVLEAIENN
jgi:thiol:disulfide interchange protein DsbD